MREVTTSPAGRLRVHALPGFVLGHLARVLQEFQSRYPQIVLDMIVNDAAIDPVKEGFDCALQIFPPRSEELISRKLFPVRRVFCASPGVRQAPRHAAPSARPDGPPHRLVLGLPDARTARLPRRERDGVARAQAGAADQQRAPAARVRAGACRHRLCFRRWWPPRRCCRATLRLVLPEYPLSSFWLSVFYPTTARSSLKLKLFLEVLTASFSGVPPWDRALIERGLLPPQIIRLVRRRGPGNTRTLFGFDRTIRSQAGPYRCAPFPS